MENLKDLRARQEFLQRSIQQNRQSSSGNKGLKNFISDPCLVDRLVSFYESIEERRYSRLKRRLYSL